MPIRTFECSCGNRYEDLDGPTIAQSDCGVCPKCQTQGKEIPSSFGFKGLLNDHLMDPVERQMLIDNRAMLEKMHLSGEVDTGAISVKDQGPAEFRPFGNDSFNRKKAMEEAQLIQ